MNINIESIRESIGFIKTIFKNKRGCERSRSLSLAVATGAGGNTDDTKRDTNGSDIRTEAVQADSNTQAARFFAAASCMSA